MAPQPISRVYDRLAPVYGLWAELTESAARRRALELAAVQPGEAVLEVAVGTGRLLAELHRAQPQARCIGVELSPGMLVRAQRRLVTQPPPAAALCRADARALPFSGACFDVLVNCYMLDLLPEETIGRVLEEFRRVLRPSGRLVLVVMAQQGRIFQGLWMWLYRHAPPLVGACRPVQLSRWLAGAWRVEREEHLVQKGFHSEVWFVRPLAREGGGR